MIYFLFCPWIFFLSFLPTFLSSLLPSFFPSYPSWFFLLLAPRHAWIYSQGLISLDKRLAADLPRPIISYKLIRHCDQTLWQSVGSNYSPPKIHILKIDYREILKISNFSHFYWDAFQKCLAWFKICFFTNVYSKRHPVPSVTPGNTATSW